MPETFQDIPTAEELTTFARELRFADYELAEFFPDELLLGTKWRFDTSELNQSPAIRYAAWDTAAPITGRQGVSVAEQALPPLREKKTIGEEEEIYLRALQTGDWSEYIQRIYDDIRNLVDAAEARWELDRGTLLGTGTLPVQMNEGPNPIIDYNVPSGNKPTAPVWWTDIANADLITQLKTYVASYKTANRGLAPGAILIPDVIAGLMMRNQALRSIIYNIPGSSAPSTLSFDRIGDELRAHGLPPIRVINSQATDTDGTYKYVMPQDKIVMIPSRGSVGATVKGVTGAALGMAREGTIPTNQAPGLVGLTWEENDPPRRFNMVDGCGMPVLRDERKLFIVKVVA